MINRSKFELNLNDRKKLSISNSRSTIFRNSLQKQNQHQSQKKQSIVNYFINKSKQAYQKPLNYEFLPPGKQNLNKKKSISLQKQQNHPNEKVQLSSIVSLLRGQRRQSILPNISKVDKVVKQRQSRTLKVEKNQKISNNETSTTNYLLPLMVNVETYKPQYESFEQNFSVDYSKEIVSPEISFIDQVKPMRKSYYSQHTQNHQQQKIDGMSDSNQFRDKIHTQLFEKYKLRTSFLTLNSLILQVKITPKTENNYKISVEIQTIQEERQFFDYLRYKRKQNLMEQDLIKAFTIVDNIKQDRAFYDQRVSKFLGFDSTKPSNDREERVFKLKSQILKLEQDFQMLIFEKYKAFDHYVKQFQKIEDLFAAQNQKVLRLIQKCKESTVKGLEPSDNERVILILDKVQKVLKNNFHETQKKICNQILKGKVYCDQAVQLIQMFRDYGKTIREQKALLKNCFGHIRKIPELCYGLLGDELPNLALKKENEVFEMPKCMQCFNSEWKLHMIIEKNQLMQSIFKVMEELFK